MLTYREYKRIGKAVGRRLKACHIPFKVPNPEPDFYQEDMITIRIDLISYWCARQGMKYEVMRGPNGELTALAEALDYRGGPLCFEPHGIQRRIENQIIRDASEAFLSTYNQFYANQRPYGLKGFVKRTLDTAFHPESGIIRPLKERDVPVMDDKFFREVFAEAMRASEQTHRLSLSQRLLHGWLARQGGRGIGPTRT